MALRLFMAVCALAQVAAVMPHHHHSLSDAMCINPLHCLESPSHDHGADTGIPACGHDHDGEWPCDGCGGGCADHFCLHNATGRHNTPGGDDCSFSHLDLNPPAKDKVTFAVPVVELSDSFIAVFPPSEPTTGGLCDRGSGRQCHSAFGGTLTLYPSYSTSAIPPRAPSQLV